MEIELLPAHLSRSLKQPGSHEDTGMMRCGLGWLDVSSETAAAVNRRDAWDELSGVVNQLDVRHFLYLLSPYLVLVLC
jgi:hypothetical protein